MSTRRTVGSLTRKDLGSKIQVPGYPEGILWGINQVGVIGDIREPFTRLLIETPNGGSEGTRGLPITEQVTVAE